METTDLVAIEGMFLISMFILMVGLEGLSLSVMADLKLCLFLAKDGLLGGLPASTVLESPGAGLVFLLSLMAGRTRGADMDAMKGEKI